MCALLQTNTSDDRPQRPPTLPGFDHIKHYWDAKHQTYTARIMPGEFFVSTANEIIATVLGSCVSACIRDVEAGVGGMNHFMLPEGGKCPTSGACLSTSARYGTYAMEQMINTILSHGGKRERLEIKLFGGGKVLQTMTDIGSRNIQFVRDYLHMESLLVTSEDLGGLHPRKVLYFPSTGRVLMRKLPLSQDEKVGQREMQYQNKLEHTPIAGEIDLF